MSAAEEGSVVALDEFHSFVVRCMKSIGISEDHGSALADLLVSADYRGHFSHGLNRLDMYIMDVLTKTTVAEGTPEIVKETVATALVEGNNILDNFIVKVLNKTLRTEGAPKIVKETVATALVEGNNILGPVIGKFCMDLAIKKAKDAGIGWVSAKGSNHFGIAGWYGLRALESGMIGMAYTNTSPLLVPTRSKEPVLGTNPICVAAPAKDGDSFVLDMATTAVALGKVELADRKDLPIPEGWAVDKQGESTTDPKLADGLCPLGGAENTSGYKGYGLSMMVEIFCGILSGSNYAHRVRKWKESQKEANLGQCFVAINPDAFGEGFEDRMSDLIQYCRNLDPVSGQSEVFVAGDPERKHMEKCDKLGGIPYHPNQIKNAERIASKLNVAPMKTL